MNELAAEQAVQDARRVRRIVSKLRSAKSQALLGKLSLSQVETIEAWLERTE